MDCLYHLEIRHIKIINPFEVFQRHVKNGDDKCLKAKCHTIGNGLHLSFHTLASLLHWAAVICEVLGPQENTCVCAIQRRRLINFQGQNFQMQGNEREICIQKFVLVTMKEENSHRKSYFLCRCLKKDEKYTGCSTDVVSTVELFCLGKHNCRIPVNNGYFRRINNCPEGWEGYLDIVWFCSWWSWFQ